VKVGEGVNVTVAVAGMGVGTERVAVAMGVGVGARVAGWHAVMMIKHPMSRIFFMALFISYPRSLSAFLLSGKLNL
jgi:hypothetical protein